MNAKFIIAAIAALCCVQGLSAASISRAATKDVLADFNEVDLDEALEQLVSLAEDVYHAVAHEEVELAREVKGTKNIFTCATSLVNAGKTILKIKDLYVEWQGVKATYKQTEEDCSQETSTAAPASDTDCLQKAEAAYKTGIDKVKSEVMPLALQVGAAAWSLKSCFSLI